MSNRQPVLFYSNKCEHSRRLIQLLQQNPGFARTIIVVDILQERKLPEFLKEVPTILAQGKLFIGQETFTWVSFMQTQFDNYNQKQEAEKSTTLPQQSIQMSQSNISNKDEYDPADDFCSKNGLGFCGLNDKENSEEGHIKVTSMASFSFIDEKNKSGGIDMAMAHDKDMASKPKSKGVDYDGFMKHREIIDNEVKAGGMPKY